MSARKPRKEGWLNRCLLQEVPVRPQSKAFNARYLFIYAWESDVTHPPQATGQREVGRSRHESLEESMGHGPVGP